MKMNGRFTNTKPESVTSLELRALCVGWWQAQHFTVFHREVEEIDSLPFLLDLVDRGLLVQTENPRSGGAAMFGTSEQGRKLVLEQPACPYCRQERPFHKIYCTIQGGQLRISAKRV